MSIQEISVSNSQKKKLQKAVSDESVLIQEESGDLVLQVSAYIDFKDGTNSAPVEEIIGEDALDLTAEYVVFS